MVLVFKKINNEKNAEIIFEINNDPIVRKQSVNSKRFSFESHLKWLKKVLRNKKENIYFVIKNTHVVGIIRLKIKNKKNYLSWAVHKQFRGKNIGKKMLKEFVEKNKKKYFAKIKKNNIRSIKICENAGFEIFRKSLRFKYFVKAK